MKLSNTTLVYIYAIVLFILTYFFASRLIRNVKSGEFDYLKLGINIVLLVYITIKIVKLGKIENNKP